MTVASSTSRVSYAGNGSTVTFTVPFYFLANTHLQVIKSSSTGVQTTLALTTDYTVTGAGVSSGGSVTCLVSPAYGETLVILRSVPFTQEVDYQPNDPFPAQTHEQALDKLTMEVQQLNEVAGRAATMPASSTASNALPTPSAGQIIGWNATGTGFENYDSTTLATFVTTGSAKAEIFSGNGVLTSFTLLANPGNQSNLDVSISGVSQRPGIDFTWTAGSTLTFVAAPPSGTNNILVRYWQGLPQGTSDSASALFIQGGTGAVSRIAQDKMRETISVKDFGAKGDGVTNDTASIIDAVTYLSTVGGGTLLIPSGIYNISSPIEVTSSNIQIKGAGCGEINNSHVLTNSSGTQIKWVGASYNGGLFNFYTVLSVTNSRIYGSGLSGVSLDCSSLAYYGLILNSVSTGRFTDIVIKNPTYVGVYSTCYSSGAIAFVADTQNNIFTNVYVNISDSVNCLTATGFFLTSSSPYLAGANTSYNEFISCGARVINGTGIVLGDADNNLFKTCGALITGTGKGLDIQGAYNNCFYHFGCGGYPSKLYVRGTASGFARNASNNCFYFPDQANGTTYPNLDTGCTIQWIGADNIQVIPSFQQFTLGYNVPTTITVVGLLTSTDAAVLYGGVIRQLPHSTTITGLMVGDSTVNATTSIASKIESFGSRTDANGSFGGKFGVGYRRCDGTAIASLAEVGVYAFGGQWGTDTSYQSAKFLYPAGIMGIAEGSFTSATAMPMGIDFRTGATGYSLNTFGQSYGTSRLRIQNDGVVRPGADNTQTLGSASFRWSTVYAGTATINTSDERTKQQIKQIDDGALSAWAKVEYCQFKFNDAVEEKGDGARWHIGLIAQRVKEAFESEGLDAFEYGLLCYDEWEAIEEDVLSEEPYVDEEGNEQIRYVPTGEKKAIREAGSRYGIRYEEALALECAYLRSKLNA